MILVVDSSDPDRFEEVAKQYLLLLKQDSLESKPLLVICSKCDLPTSVSLSIISRHIKLSSNPWKAPYKIIQSSINLNTRSAVDEGLKFLLFAVHQNYDTINEKIASIHEKDQKTQDTNMKLQRQRVSAQKEELSSLESSMIAPGQILAYDDNDREQSLSVMSARRRSVLEEHVFNRPASAPLQYIRKYAEKNEFSF